MVRKIFSGILIALSSILLITSLVGIGAAWYYNEPLTEESVARLGEIESELAQTQTALQQAKAELERTLRIVDSAEETLEQVSDELAQAKQLFDEFDKTLGDRLIPGLESSRDRLASLRGTLEDLRVTLEDVNSLPFVDLNLPGDEMLANLIETVNSIDAQIERMKGLADKASTFAEDVSFLMGGDFSETRQRLETFVQVVTEYEQKIAGWHAQVETWIVSVPGWIDRASIILTVFLFWFGLSQFGLLLHGLALWRGGDPLVVVRRESHPALPPPDEPQLDPVEEEEWDEDDEDPANKK
jgi:vacuolar-type H+-ATPase subunit I/STV1